MSYYKFIFYFKVKRIYGKEEGEFEMFSYYEIYLNKGGSLGLVFLEVGKVVIG